MTTARDFSVMPVMVEGAPVAIERAVRRKGNSLNAGSYCDVEFGATWRYLGTVAMERVEGQWRQCEVLRHEGAIVHVRLAPSVTGAPPVFG
jgi:hypothetical protein